MIHGGQMELIWLNRLVEVWCIEGGDRLEQAGTSADRNQKMLTKRKKRSQIELNEGQNGSRRSNT